MSAIDLAAGQHLPRERLDLSVVDRPVNLPIDLAFSPDGQRLYVAHLGSGDVSILDLVAQRGQVIFERSDVGCATCRSGPRLSDASLAALPLADSPRATYAVGSGDAPDEGLGPAFKTPSLRASWDRGPSLHDGSGPTCAGRMARRLGPHP